MISGGSKISGINGLFVWRIESEATRCLAVHWYSKTLEHPLLRLQLEQPLWTFYPR